MKTRLEPLAIITSGGGMRCSYSAGAVVALGRELGLLDPDIFISSSGSVGAMFYYLTRQFGEIERAWTKYIPSKHFIRYFPFPYMDIDYLVDTVFKQLIPFDTDALEQTQTRYLVPITNARTGRTRFVNNDTWFNAYEVMRAAKAVPILYNGHIQLGDSKYLDGDFSTTVANLVHLAIAKGAKRILCIVNTDGMPPDFLTKAVIHGYALTLNPSLRASVLKDIQDSGAIELPPDIKFVQLSASGRLPAGLFSREPERIVQSYQMGYHDVMDKRAELEALFS